MGTSFFIRARMRSLLILLRSLFILLKRLFILLRRLFILLKSLFLKSWRHIKSLPTSGRLFLAQPAFVVYHLEV